MTGASGEISRIRKESFSLLSFPILFYNIFIGITINRIYTVTCQLGSVHMIPVTGLARAQTEMSAHSYFPIKNSVAFIWVNGLAR